MSLMLLFGSPMQSIATVVISSALPRFYTTAEWVSLLKDFDTRIVGGPTDNIMYSISVFSLTRFFDTEVVLGCLCKAFTNSVRLYVGKRKDN